MINIYKDNQELSIAFCDELFRLGKLSERFNMALSGGSTPKIIFEELSKNYKDKFDWNEIHFFWGDERCVCPDDDESNFGLAKKYLLDHINIPEENVHRIKGEAEPETEAGRYSREILDNVKVKNGLPCFDYIMLGLGEDGHTASIFPDQMYLLDSKEICEVAVHPITGQKRITLTGRVINNSDAVRFLVTGDNKAEILKKILTEKNKIYPAEFIKPINNSLIFYIDSNAAKLISHD